MKNYDLLSTLSKDELIELIDIYSKNLIALDGVWFQSIEQHCGMDEAMFHDGEAWRRYAAIEGRRIKAFLKLDEHPGLSGLEQALKLRFSSMLHVCRFDREDDSLVYTLTDCRVQCARKRKGMPYHPCKPVGLIEYSQFAQAIDERIRCECLSCYPEITDESCSCKWKFTITDSQTEA